MNSISLLQTRYSVSGTSQAWIATGIPGFVNSTFAHSDPSSQNVDYSACTAAISNSNVQTTAVTPSPSNTTAYFY